ncbi:MAG TPA: hypothetical protein VGD67_08200 [Pseudonocardiaceae bacterium]
MSDDPPGLMVPASELWQWAQAVNAVTAFAGWLRRSRERAGRLAFADEAHAEFVHQVREAPPPVRPMTDDERSVWADRVPVEMVIRPDDQLVTVWTAQLVDESGAPTGEWGVEAHCWVGNSAVASAFVVCRDPVDALALTRQLRAEGTAAAVRRVQSLADGGPAGQPHALTEQEWLAALRRGLPGRLAERIVADDPGHPHHAAWRELWALAAEEVSRVGADPDRLVGLIATIPRWRDDVRNPPALAHWALTEARASTTYESVVRGEPRRAEQPVPVAPRLREVRDPAAALAWASHLVADDPVHRIEAQQGFGRWGSEVDAILARTFDGLLGAVATPPNRSAVVDPAVVAELRAEVERLDPQRPIDRRAARIMLGRVPDEVTELIAQRFAGEPAIEERLGELYPDGVPWATNVATAMTDRPTAVQPTVQHQRQAAPGR